MARHINRLSAKAVKTLATPGYHPDGAGLYLQVSSSGAKSWVFRFTLNGRSREMGLGSLLGVSLEKARAAARGCRELLAQKVDPLDARDEQRRGARLAAARALTFDLCAQKYIEAHGAAWTNAKHAQQWRNSLATYASPVIGADPVPLIDTASVLRVVEPLWLTKNETANRVRNRIELVLDWAKAMGYREGENPARYRGHLDKLLAKRSKVRHIKNHPAMPYRDVPAFMAKLRARTGVTAKTLEFIVLTAARMAEATAATWDEFDLVAHVWTVPASRMKARRAHRVPLSSPAMAVINDMKALQRGVFVFPGLKEGRHIGNSGCDDLLDAMKIEGITVHGFRSSFRDWAAEQTSFAREVVEKALAHTVGSKVEEAYQRSDLLERRAALMADWANYIETPQRAAEVTLIRKV